MADLALTGGRVVTMDDADTVGEALLIRDGRVAHVGSTADVVAAASGADRIDLAGRVVLPGLIDAHTHVEFCALSRRQWLDVRLIPRAETLQRLTSALSGSGGVHGDWLIAQGSFGQDLPSRAELDGVSGEVPILVRESMHRLVANSAALARAGIRRGFTSRVGTRVEVGADGEPTGVVEEGFHLFPTPQPPVGELAAMLRDELVHSFARHGVTTIYELPATSGGVRAYQRLNRQGRLPVRMSLNLVVAPGLNPIVASIDQWTSIGLATGFGDDRLWLGAAKVFLDGDDTASMDRSRLHLPPSRWGTPTRHYAEIVELLVAAEQSGIQVWIHAIGDVAQSLALDAIDETRRVTGTAEMRTRLEHVANLWVDDALLERLARLDVIPVPTAAFIYADPGTGVYAYETLLANGFRPPGNSDTGGTQPFATNPWFGIASMVHRRNREGREVAPGQTVDVMSGIRTYTTFAAEAGFQEAKLGALSPGRYGDCAVYAVDPRTIPPEDLETLEADLTVVDGEVVWDRGGELT